MSYYRYLHRKHNAEGHRRFTDGCGYTAGSDDRKLKEIMIYKNNLKLQLYIYIM